MWEKGGKLFKKGNKRAAGIRVRKDSAYDVRKAKARPNNVPDGR